MFAAAKKQRLKAILNEAIRVVETDKNEKVKTEKDEIKLDVFFVNNANIKNVEILFQRIIGVIVVIID